MGRLAVVALVGLVACIEPSLTICGDTACSTAKVCDGHGGCVLPEQVNACATVEAGTECAYPGATGTCVDGICEPYGCGNRVITADEVCDDGNTDNGDGCSADCRSNETCGNGYVDGAAGEQCDDTTVDCHGCVLAHCGDGVLDPQLGETCDAGTGNSLVADATCRPGCVPQRCGDGVKDTLHGEVCDDGNLISGDGCRPDCLSNETCGNGELDFVVGELCDDGNTSARDGCSACQLEPMIALVPGEVPAARSRHAMAYDGGRERVVLFGGLLATGVLSNETWEWDGSSWTQMHPKTQPRARMSAAMAYDPKRKRVLMFGGGTLFANFNETWEWDGTDWTVRTPLSPADSPSPRQGAGLAFDGITGEMLLVGGSYERDSYTWNGTRWLPRPFANSLALAFYATAVYAPDQSAVVAVIANQTFMWDGAEWNNLDAAPGNGDVGGMSLLAWDATRQRVVLWPAASFGNQLYELVGSQWQPAETGPPARNLAALVYDTARRQLVLNGGVGTGDQTWLYPVGNLWSQVGNWPTPQQRRSPAFGYDPLRGRAVMFGLHGETIADLWEFDGRRWIDRSAIAPPASQLAPGVFAYDRGSRRLVMYGGRNASQQPSGDIVGFDGTSWTAIAPPQPTPSLNAGFAYDSTHGTSIVFGGNPYTGCECAEPTTSVWTGTAWTSTATGPSRRRATALAHDPLRGRTVLYGGTLATAGGLGDTWEWDGATWTEHTQAQGPTARRGHAMVFHADLGRVVMLGSSGTGIDDLWIWSGSAWSMAAIQPPQLERYRASLTYLAAAHALVWVSGTEYGAGNIRGTRLFQYRANSTPEACTSATLDYDNDGLAGCADPECWARCTPLCTPGLACDPALPRCGDGTCTGVEDCRLCPTDCGACPGALCGDFTCDTNETPTGCPTDC